VVENLWLVLVVVAICSYLSIKAWANARRAEREALYRSETLKKFAEMQGTVPDSVLNVLKEAVKEKYEPPSSINYDYNREREAYYRSENLKKIVESEGGAAAALEYLRDDERKAIRRSKQALKLGGMVTAAAGLGLAVFLYAVIKDEPIYLAGLVPALVGLVMIVFAISSAPND